MRPKSLISLGWLVFGVGALFAILYYVGKEEGRDNPMIKKVENLVEGAEEELGLKSRKEWGVKQTIHEHFDAWAGNEKEKNLSFVQVDKLVSSPHVTGDQAAALAAIHRGYFHTQPTSGGGEQRELLASLDELLAAADKLEPFYRDGCQHLDQVDRQIFGPGAPTINGIAQGHLADCYLIATLGALAHHRPDEIRKLIRVRDDLSCDVTFHDGEFIHVPKLSDGLIVLSSRCGKQGLWLNILETAYGKHRLAKENGRFDLPEDVLNYGYPARVMQLLTGQAGKILALQGQGGASLDGVRDVLRSGVERKSVLVAMTGKKAKVPPGMIANHCYTILDFDAQADKVKIWNPLGLNFEPKDLIGLEAAASIEHGYLTKGGVFEVPLTDFVRIYSWITY
ncbi:MAG: C2 family cysteine protease [Gemmataceae bacterium]